MQQLQDALGYIVHLEDKLEAKDAKIIALEARILRGIADNRKQGVLLDDLISDEEVDGC